MCAQTKNHDTPTPTSSRGIDPVARARHVRYFEVGVVYHIVSRTHGNLFLLRPDLEGFLRKTVVGILAEAKGNWGNVVNFATVVMSNHMHSLVAVTGGDPRNISDYIGFLKKELTRRWRREVDWPNSIWEGYECTALVTPEAQVNALAYVLGHGPKENLTLDPREWPGFHCAESLVTGEPMQGHWLDGTRFGKDWHAQKVKLHPEPVRREDYFYSRSFSFDPLPALAHLDDGAYRAAMLGLVEEAVAERERNFDSPPLGAEAVCAMAPLTMRPVAEPPWFEERRHLIAWDDRCAPEVQAYLERYWEHQVKYRKASQTWREAGPDAAAGFPDFCFVPGMRPRPIAHQEESTS